MLMMLLLLLLLVMMMVAVVATGCKLRAKRLVLAPQRVPRPVGALDLRADGLDVGFELFRVVCLARAVLDLRFAHLGAPLVFGGLL